MKRILAALICLSLLFPCSAAGAEPFPFAGGSGSAADPYLIENETQLQAVDLYPDACFLMTRDIACTADWKPVGTQTDPFTGCFDGGGHTITGLHATAHVPGGAYLGLFAWNAGTVRNVRIVNCFFSASAMIACAGGIAAVNSGIIEGCSVSGQLDASTAAGGIAGKNEPSGILRRCHSSCAVSADAAGGISGTSAGQTTNCFNTGTVSGYAAGGITGQGRLPSCCFNTGVISGTLCGGIVGDVPLYYENQHDGSTCFFLEHTPAGTGNHAACVKLTHAQMGLAESFTGFDFDAVWYMSNNHPLLRQKAPSKPPVPKSLELTALPAKTEYLENEPFCPDGITVVLRYSNGTCEPVTDYLIGGYQATPGEHTVTVTYGGLSATFTVTVKAVTPDVITSPVYTVASGWLRKIPLGTTVSTLTAGLNNSTFIAVLNGEAKAHANAYIRTGMTVAIMEGDTVKTSLTAVVTGDVSSDGKLTAADVLAVKSHLLKSAAVTGAAAQAADCNADGKVTLTDFLLLKAHVLGKYTVHPN